MGSGNGNEENERAMAKADLRQTLAEKLEGKGRIPQSCCGGVWEMEREPIGGS